MHSYTFIHMCMYFLPGFSMPFDNIHTILAPGRYLACQVTQVFLASSSKMKFSAVLIAACVAPAVGDK